MSKSWLTNSELAAMDQELFKYNGIDRAIATRKVELTIKKPRENIGGGSGGHISNEPHEIAVKWDTDKVIVNLRNLQHNVDRLYAGLSDECKAIFNLRWKERKSWEQIGDEVYASCKTAYNRRQFILEQYAEIKGLHYLR